MTLALIWNQVWGWLKQLPDWAWWIFLGLAAGVWIDMRARKAEREKQKAASQAARDRQILKTTQETLDRVETYHEDAGAVERLPDDELFERTEADPNNRGRVSRG